MATLPDPQAQPLPAMPLPMPPQAPSYAAPIELDPLDGPLQPSAVQHSNASQTAMAAAIVFIVAIVGLWAVLGYMHAMAKTLSSVDASNKRIIGQLNESKVGLVKLDHKTQAVVVMAKNSTKLRELMVGLDTEMGTMLSSVDSIGTEMGALSGSLDKLDSEVAKVGTTNVEVTSGLNKINAGLGKSAATVKGMRSDITKTAHALTTIPPYLVRTNARLGHVNFVVNHMGRNGVVSPLVIHVSFLGIPNGGATIKATMIPPGAWG